MIDKDLTRPQPPAGTRVSSHGSSLYRSGDTLDEERAASMADEGGASGALTDALEQAGSTVRESLAARRGWRLPRWVPWTAAALGLASAWLIWSRQR